MRDLYVFCFKVFITMVAFIFPLTILGSILAIPIIGPILIFGFIYGIWSTSEKDDKDKDNV